jgi:hypothetical protein
MTHDGNADRQLPRGDEIFLDRIAHFVRDRDAAAQALARAGFAPTPLSVQVNPDPLGGAPQPTGTGNVTAMFARGYIEVLFKTADTPLAREFEAALARYPGLHLAAFAVADAAQAHARLGGAAFRTRPLVQMQRPLDVDGKPGTAAFTLARVEAGEMPEGRIQMLTHRTEAAVWQPRWLTHPNGAVALTRVIIAVRDVAEAAARFARFTGRPASPHRHGATLALDRGFVDLMAVDAFTKLFPELPIPDLPFMAGCAIAVRSLAETTRVFVRGGIAVRPYGPAVVARFPDALGHGAWLFSEPGVPPWATQ